MAMRISWTGIRKLDRIGTARDAFAKKHIADMTLAPPPRPCAKIMGVPWYPEVCAPQMEALLASKSIHGIRELVKSGWFRPIMKPVLRER